MEEYLFTWTRPVRKDRHWGRPLCRSSARRTSTQESNGSGMRPVCPQGDPPWQVSVFRTAASGVWMAFGQRTFGTQQVEMRIGEKAVQFASEDRELTVRRLFADDTLTLEEVFTKLPQGRHRVRRTELLGAIRYLQDAVGSKARATTCLQGTSLVVSGSTGQYGAELNMETPFEAKPTVDLRYMKEALEQFAGAEYVTLCVTDPPMPLFLFDESGENAAVVLPVRESASLPRQSAA